MMVASVRVLVVKIKKSRQTQKVSEIRFTYKMVWAREREVRLREE